MTLEDLQLLEKILMDSNARPTEYNPIIRKLYAVVEENKKLNQIIQSIHDRCFEALRS